MWNLAMLGISVYIPHTAWDSAANGINQQIANGIGLTNTAPIVVNEKDDNLLGAGRCGDWTGTLSHLAKVLCEFLHIESLQKVGNLDDDIFDSSGNSSQIGNQIEMTDRTSARQADEEAKDDGRSDLRNARL